MEKISVETWRAITLAFTSACTFEDPAFGHGITASFTGPSGRVINREAYWDGGEVYKFSFAPTEIGPWSYTVSASEASGLNGITGAIDAVPYEGELDIYKHGFLRVSDNGRCLSYADGTPFFWLGDTHWEFAYRESWDESNHPEMKSQFCGMVDRRAEQGFTVYQTNLRSDMGAEGRYWSDEESGVPNVEFYQRELDRRMAYIADAGLVNALGQSWCFSVAREDGVEHEKKLARYLVARYGALPVVWTLAGEVAGYDPSPTARKTLIDGWREVAREIELRDGYGTLQTAHYTNERPFADYYQDEEWYDFTLNQAGHGDYLITASDYSDFLRDHGDKPFIEGEALYEYCSTLEEMGTRLCTADMLRRVAYMSIQLGGCGYTYGAQGIWDNIWEKPEHIDSFMGVFNRFGITWAKAVDGEGAVQMGYMRQFYERVHFWELAPLGGYAKGNLFGRKTPFISSNEDRTRLVAYLGDTVRKAYGAEGFEAGRLYLATWFDPRTGEYTQTKPVVSNDEGTLEIPVKPDLGDWCLVLESE